MTWLTTQEGRRGSDETFVMQRQAQSGNVRERAYWLLVERRMRDTADSLAAARAYAEGHPDEVDGFVSEFQSVSENAGDAPGSVVSEDVESVSDSNDMGSEIGPGDVSEGSTGGFDIVDVDAEEDFEFGEDGPTDEQIEQMRREFEAENPDAGEVDGGARASREDFIRHHPKVRQSPVDASVVMSTIKGVPRHVYGQVESELVACGAFDAARSYTQGDVVTVALAYLCDLSGDGLTEKQARALEAFRRNEKNVQFETVRNINRLSHRIEDLMRTATATLTLESYMARRSLGMSMSETPAVASDVDFVNDEGQDDFYDQMLAQGAIRYERDMERLGRDISSSRFGLKMI